MRNNLKQIALILLIVLTVTFLRVDYGLASSSDSSLEKRAGVVTLVGLGIWGVYRRVRSRREARYQAHLQDGEMYLKEGDYELAVANLEEAKAIDDTSEVSQLLNRARLKYQEENYQLGLDYLEQEEWELAYRSFRNIAQYDSNYKELALKQEEAYQKLREIKLKRIAILDFSDTSYRYNLGRRASSLFISQLLEKEPKFIEVIERGQINAILEEQHLSQSGLVDSSTAQEIGNILGVDFLITGDVISGSVSQDESSSDDESSVEDIKTAIKEAYTRVNFRLLDVSTGAVKLSRTIAKRDRYEDSYYEGETIVLPSNEEMLDQVLIEAVDELARLIYERYEI
ncbi:curli polymer formation protein [Natroniella acetigena]|uniref:CsgG/HfaB family protein n=1 Tax=Natroniella acetigena TaxID=52004 RepID=UPI00200B67F9|nr:CsgG/HfaB family protein [Natroniella acetigena]MCK8828211.1 curli polymer formation protein [Natroniella acetigena]